MATEQVEEEEEERQEHKTGRSAFFAGVHHADTFSGAFRGVPAIKHGGAASVRPEDTIGDETHCWCGELVGHSWPGKDKGVKHPRGDKVSTAAAEDKPYLNPRDLKSWDRVVVRALCELVNTYGVRYRIDSNNMHVYLYAPGEQSDDVGITKLKASRSRSANQQLHYIEVWAEKYVRPVKVEEAATVLAEKLNDPTKRRHEKAPQKAATSEPVPEPTEAPKPSESPSPASPAPTPEPGGEEPLTFQGGVCPEGYHQHLNQEGEETNWWVSDTEPKRYVCKTCGATHRGNGFAHQRMHSMTYEERRDASLGSNAAKQTEVISTQARRTRARNAIRFLAEEFDIPLATGTEATKVGRLEQKVARLEQKVADLTKERDDAQAKFELARELFQS